MGRSTPTGQPSDGVAWLEIPKALLRGRRILVRVAVVAAVLGVVIALLVPRNFRSSALLVPSTLGGGSGVSSLLAGVAGQLGVDVNLGGGTLPLDFIVRLAQSRTTLEAVAHLPVPEELAPAQVSTRDRSVVDLLEIDAAPEHERLVEAVEQLRDNLTASADHAANTIRLAFTNPDPDVAQFVLEGIVAETNEATLDAQRTAARSQSGFLQEQLVTTTRTLRQIEDSLRVFYERNREWAGSPRLVFEEFRLRSEVERLRGVRSALDQHLIQTEFLAARTVPAVLQIDGPDLPVEPAGLRRAFLAIGIFTLIILLTGTVLVFASWWRHDRARHAADWSELESEARAAWLEIRRVEKPDPRV